jgi:hypothetical protein
MSEVVSRRSAELINVIAAAKALFSQQLAQQRDAAATQPPNKTQPGSAAQGAKQAGADAVPAGQSTTTAAVTAQGGATATEAAMQVVNEGPTLKPKALPPVQPKAGGMFGGAAAVWPAAKPSLMGSLMGRPARPAAPPAPGSNTGTATPTTGAASVQGAVGAASQASAPTAGQSKDDATNPVKRLRATFTLPFAMDAATLAKQRAESAAAAQAAQQQEGSKDVASEEPAAPATTGAGESVSHVHLKGLYLGPVA